MTHRHQDHPPDVALPAEPIAPGRLAAILLAAGGSTRLGSPKQLLRDAHGETLVHRSARTLLQAGCWPVIVVTGSSAEEVTSSIEDLQVEVFLNPSWREGMGSSVAAGSTYVAATAPTADGLLVAACDMPGIDVTHLQALMDCSEYGIKRAASSYQDDSSDQVIGIPAVFPRSDWPSLMKLQGDQGARALLRREPPATVPLTGGRFDIDTPQDVEKWRATMNPMAHDRAPFSASYPVADVPAPGLPDPSADQR